MIPFFKFGSSLINKTCYITHLEFEFYASLKGPLLWSYLGQNEPKIGPNNGISDDG